MSDYRRAWYPGGAHFFTVNLLHRYDNDLLIRHIEVLRDVVRLVKTRHSFRDNNGGERHLAAAVLGTSHYS